MPLLTTGPVPLTSPGGFGVLGQAGTQVLLGNQTFDQGQSDGARFTIGGWTEPWINNPSLFRRCAAPAIFLPRHSK